MTDLERAKLLLEEGGYSCVLCKGDCVLPLEGRGVKPVLALLDEGRDVKGFSVADKVVGKAMAMLYCLLSVSRVYAGVISDGAVRVFEEHGIEAAWDRRTQAIRNRAGDGLCPMEQAVRELKDPALAPEVLRQALERLK